MRSNTIFNYIQVYLAPGDSKQYQEKTTVDRTTSRGDLIKGGKPYFFCTYLRSMTHLSIENSQYHIREQHLSIYAEYQDDILGLEAYHLTVNLTQGSRKFIFHCYYDQHGNITDVMMKEGDVVIVLNEVAKRQLKTYGLQAVGRIQELNQSLLNKTNELLAAIEGQEKHAEELSRNKNLKNNLKPFVAALCKLIDLVKELNFITNQSQAKTLSILETMVSASKVKLLSGKRQKNPSAVPKNKIPAVIAPEKKDPPLKPIEVKEKKAETETLETVNKKLALLKGGDLATLQEQQRLLEIKLKLIPSSNFENMIAINQNLKRLIVQIDQARLNLALNGNIEAANTMVANNYPVPLYFYIDLITNQQEEVFDILFKACPYSISLRMGRLTVDTSSYQKRKDLLTAAYSIRSEKLFNKLLFTYHCDPDMLDMSGVSLLYIVAAQGEISYAKMLLDAEAHLNITTKAPTKLKAEFLMNPSIAKKQQQEANKQAQGKFEAKMAAIRGKTIDWTPLMAAACGSQDKMVNFLVERKADVNVRGEDGLDAMGLLASQQDESLHIPSISALLEAGMSIDSVNDFSSGEQSSPLHYRCQWLDEEAVRILVNRFAANPNVLVRKKTSATDRTYMSCLTVVTCKTASPETQEKANRILLFLLDQDIRPMVSYSLTSSVVFFRMQSAELNSPIRSNLATEEFLKLNQRGEMALENHEYAEYCDLSLKIVAAYQSNTFRAITKNQLKLSLISAAEEDLNKQAYQHCLNACHVIIHAKFNIEQYNERLWATCYQAHLGLRDDENACTALERYLNILTRKSAQVLSPKYKAEINKKIEKANGLLIEIHQRLLSKKTTLSVRPAVMSFTAELKEQNIKKLANLAVIQTFQLQSKFGLQ